MTLDLQDLAIAVPVGIAVGVLLGALGGGGAILAVPALVYLLGQQPHSATTASLIIVIISASASLVGHWRAGRVRLGSGVAFAAAGLAGSFLGSRLSGMVNPDVLLLGFAGLMLVVAGVMFVRQRREGAAARAKAAEQRPPSGRVVAGGSVAGDRRLQARRLGTVVATATGIGFLTGLFGVGGGIIVVPTLVLALGFAMPIAVGTSLVVIILNSVAALATRLGSHPAIDWPLVAVFTAAAVAGALGGSRIADRTDARRLTQAFTVLVVVVAIYTASRSLLHLV